MRKQYIDFEEEEQQTLAFMEKLKQFKSASKNIKQKTKQTAHKLEWQKEYAKMLKQESLLTREVEGDLGKIDQNYEEQIKEFKIFDKDQNPGFWEFYQNQNEQYENFSGNIWYQVQNFKQICKELKFKYSSKFPNIKSQQQKPGVRRSSLAKKSSLKTQSQVQKIKPEQGNKMGQEKDEIQQYKELKDEIKEFLVQMKGLSDEEFQIMNMGKKYKLTFQYKENDLLNDMDNDNIEDLNEYIIEEVTEIQEEEEEEEKSQNLEQEEQDEKVDQVKFITQDLKEGTNDSSIQEKQWQKKQRKLKAQLENLNEKDLSGIIGYLKTSFQNKQKEEEDLDFQGEEQLILEQYVKALKFLKERYKLEIYKIRQEYYEGKKNFESIKNITNQINMEHFRHIYRTYFKQGKEREKYIERLELHFPDLSKKNINIIDQFIEDNEYQNQKLNALYRNFEKERKELKEKVEEQIMNLFNIRLENLEKNNIKVRSQQEQQRLREEIEAQKIIFEIKQQKIEAQKEMEKEVEQIQKQRKNQEWEQYHGVIKKQAGAYKQEKILKIREKQEETIKRKVEIEQKRKEEVLKNAPKVQQRQIQSYIKIQENIDKMDLKTYQKQYDQERIKYAVQNYQHIPQVEADFKRVVQDTKAREIRKQTVLDKADKVDMQNYQGFTANQLMKDMRYRLSTALQEAGLNNAKYSNQVLNQLSKPSQNNIY